MLMFFVLASCNLEKEIDVPLPTRESSLVVECYLEPGEPYRLILYESEGFFKAPGPPPSVEDAEVYIFHSKDTIELKNLVSIDFERGRIFNYSSNAIVPNEYYSEYRLLVKDKKGRVLSGITTNLPPVEIDSIKWIYNEEGDQAGPAIYFQDDPAVDNYYRYLVNADSLTGDIRRDFLINDATFQTSQALITARPRSDRGVTLYLSLLNLTSDHYKFLESTEGAVRANSNPFGQASSIQSNVRGGYGIFTGLSRVNRTVIVP